MEQESLYALGADGQPDVITPQQMAGTAQMTQQVLSGVRLSVTPGRRVASRA